MISPEATSTAVQTLPAGFWTGLLDGLLTPLTIPLTWLDPNRTFHVVENTGWPYHTGLILGALYITTIVLGTCGAGGYHIAHKVRNLAPSGRPTTTVNKLVRSRG